MSSTEPAILGAVGPEGPEAEEARERGRDERLPDRVFPGPGVRRLGRWLINVWVLFGFLFLFAPVIVLVLFSFNQPATPYNLVWDGFTLENWAHPFAIPELVDALEESLKIAALATLIAVAMGALVALALTRYRFRGNAAVNLLLVLPLTTPEVVLGAALASLFLDQNVDRGFTTVVISHVMFCVAFVALTVKARLRGFDWTLEDAAMDLGAGPLRVFAKITFPLMIPGILAAALLSFALSLDDFIITQFNAGPGPKAIVTFPLYVFGAQQRAWPPQINVLTTMILVVSVSLLALGVLFQGVRGGRRARGSAA
jgi:spermidine/putrescine transport system permease protein